MPVRLFQSTAGVVAQPVTKATARNKTTSNEQFTAEFIFMGII